MAVDTVSQMIAGDGLFGIPDYGKAVSKKRPDTTYSKEIGNQVLFRMINGETIVNICKDNAMPSIYIINKWISSEYTEDFARRFHEAKLGQADTFAMEVVDIANDLEKDIEEKQNEVAADLASEGVSLDRIRIAVDQVRKTKLEAAKMKIDSRKWISARMNPGNWGDKTTVALNVSGSVKMNLSDYSDEQLAQIDAMQRSIDIETIKDVTPSVSKGLPDA